MELAYNLNASGKTLAHLLADNCTFMSGAIPQVSAARALQAVRSIKGLLPGGEPAGKTRSVSISLRA
jgi:hypothetical protein